MYGRKAPETGEAFTFYKAKKNHRRVIFYADNTFLPLARRRANTLRPPTVAIRALNP